MWAQAVRLFRLSPREAWNLGLDEFRALVEAHKEAERQEDYRAGVVAALFANANREKGAAPFGPEDFFPSLAGQASAGAKEMDEDETRDYMMALFVGLGAKVETREA